MDWGFLARKADPVHPGICNQQDLVLPYSGCLTKYRDKDASIIDGIPKLTDRELVWESKFPSNVGITRTTEAIFAEVKMALTKSKGIVIDPYIRTGSSALACMALSSFRYFLGAMSNHRIALSYIPMVANEKLPNRHPPITQVVTRSAKALFRNDVPLYFLINVKLERQEQACLLPAKGLPYSQNIPRKILVRVASTVPNGTILIRNELHLSNPSKWKSLVFQTFQFITKFCTCWEGRRMGNIWVFSTALSYMMNGEA